MALIGRKLGKKVIARRREALGARPDHRSRPARGVKPLIGMRSKLYARGAGKWAKSGGDTAKFGLTTPEILEAVKILKPKKMLDCLVMLHFHIGSQITDILTIKEAVTRGRARLREAPARWASPIEYLDVGGGLGVDYDGSRRPRSTRR